MKQEAISHLRRILIENIARVEDIESDLREIQSHDSRVLGAIEVANQAATSLHGILETLTDYHEVTEI